MSLVSMIIADRMESLTQYYDRYGFVLGYMYQSSTPVIYWKRIWR